MLLQRLLTALIAIPIVLAAIIYMPPIYFSVVVGVFILIGAWEWSGFLSTTQKSLRAVYVVLVALGLVTSAFLPETIMLMIASLMWVWVFIAIVEYQREKPAVGFQFPVVRGVAGFFILIATWDAVLTLRTHPSLGPAWLITVMLLVWGADIGAYFAGRFLGHRKLCSRVSPKKTWEGFAGGMVFSIAIAAVCGFYLSLSFSHYCALLAIAVITALFSVVGDLGVSLFKRMSDMKDSGAIFPGHGGMLDRLDSIAAATVIFVLGVLFF